MTHPQPQVHWISTLRELIVLAERDAWDDAPEPYEVRQRIPYWIDQISQLLDRTSKLAIVVQMAGQGPNGTKTSFVHGSPRALPFFDTTFSNHYGSGFLVWSSISGLSNVNDLNGLPYYDDENPCEIFSPDFIGEQETFLSTMRFKHVGRVMQCINDINKLEDYGPPHGKAGMGIFKSLDAPTFVLLPGRHYSDGPDRSQSYIEQPVPAGFHQTEGPNAAEIHGVLVPTWYRTKPFTHRKSGSVYGGFNGVRLGMLIILRLLFGALTTLTTEPPSQPASSPSHPPDLQLSRTSVLTYISQALYHLQQDVTQAIELLRRTYRMRQNSTAFAQHQDQLPTVPDSLSAPRILMTAKAERGKQAWRRNREAEPGIIQTFLTHTEAAGATSSTNMDVSSTTQPASTASSALQPAPASSAEPAPSTPRSSLQQRHPRPPRKSISAPDLVQEIVQSNLVETTPGFDIAAPPQSVYSSPGVPPQDIPMPTAGPIHSPPSTVGHSRSKKRSRPNKESELDPKGKASQPKDKPKQRSRRGWVTLSEDEDVNPPSEPEPEPEPEPEHHARHGVTTRSGTGRRQATVPPQQPPIRSRATSTTSVVTDNPPPLDPSADSSWAAPVMSQDMNFSMFGGAVIKKPGTSTAKGASASTDPQASGSGTSAGTRATSTRAGAAASKRQGKKR